jgi:serine/threonine protein kinase
MQRPLLLIVDGESLKNPGLEKALEKEGWDLAWTTSQQALNVGLMGQEPSVVILDPAKSGPAGARSIQGLREHNPSLPVVALRGSEPVPAAIQASAFLDRDLPQERWPMFLREFLPKPTADRKLTTEDLFGDILADIGGSVAPAAPKPAAPQEAKEAQPAPQPLPKAAPVHAAAPPVKPLMVQMPGTRPIQAKSPAPPVVSPLKKPAIAHAATPHAQAPITPAHKPVPAPSPAPLAIQLPKAPEPEPLVELPKLDAEPLAEEPELLVEPADTPAPEPAVIPAMPEQSVLPDLFGDLLGPLVQPPPTKTKHEFTLSGFSGIHDPFEVKSKEELPPPASEKEPAKTKNESRSDTIGSLGNDVLELEFIGSSDNTPASRPADQAAASLVHQPPPKIPTPSEAELLKDPFDAASLEEFGNYYLLEKIAVGGMAELFKARQRGVHNFEKIVAIKRILPHLSDNDEFVRMFIDEAKLAAQLTHPNIVQIFDLGKAGGFYYIAMEYVDGKDLRSLLRKVREYHQPFPEAVAAYVTMKVAMALDYAHRKRGMNDKELKLVHRDVSPQNVLISSEGAVKLVDFGIAKAATKTTQTMAGALKGKLLYMSPEQALGQALDNRSDIYSLGLVLFELLTGERCFQADSELGVLEKVRLGKVQDVQAVNPAVSRDMANIINMALQKNVDQRYGSARLMERDLKSLLVRHGNEPTDHEVAEYVNTLLKGTKEQLETLLSTHFAIKPPKVESVPAPVVNPKVEDPPTTVEFKKTASQAAPPPEMRKEATHELPRWLLPLLLVVILALLSVVWYFVRTPTG